MVSLPSLWIHLHLKDYLLTATIATHSSYGDMEIVQYFQELKYSSTIWKVVRPEAYIATCLEVIRLSGLDGRQCP